MICVSNILYRLYAIKRIQLRAWILRGIMRMEKGDLYSQTLRRIFRDYHRIDVGLYSYGGCFNAKTIRPFTTIGRYCSFAEGVCIFNANHPLEFKSTHPFFYEPLLGYVAEETIERRHITIGNDVWVGQNAIILSSVNKIGDGAVVGAGSVVTRNVPDFAVVAGNPARILKYRLPEFMRERIKAEAWWDKDIEDLLPTINEYSRPVPLSIVGPNEKDHAR